MARQSFFIAPITGVIYAWGAFFHCLAHLCCSSFCCSSIFCTDLSSSFFEVWHDARFCGRCTVASDPRFRFSFLFCFLWLRADAHLPPYTFFSLFFPGCLVDVSWPARVVFTGTRRYQPHRGEERRSLTVVPVLVDVA
jgi:hypothetical protein